MNGPAPVVLLANDDGIDAEGLRALEQAMPPHWEVYVVAPDRPRNAASHALTLDAPIQVNTLGGNRFSTSGTPTDCVNIAVHRLLPRRPDIVLSGINAGANLCEDVTYSGTVAAALEACLLSIPAVAFSLAARDRFRFGPAGEIARTVAAAVLRKGLPPGVLLNVNVPNLLNGAAGEIRWTRLGRKVYGDCLMEEEGDGASTRWFRFGRDPMQYRDGQDARDTDWKAVEQGDVSVTPLRLNRTDEPFLRALEEGYYGRAIGGHPGVEASPPGDG